jgi:RimJ/RimL family protein N-acetyltransferase
MTFATARLTARPPCTEDAPAVFAAYASDPVVTRYLSWRTHEEAESLAAFFAKLAGNWETGNGQLAWLLFLKGSSLPVGSIGLDFEGGGRVLFGYVLARQYWGRGLMAEALTFLVDWALVQPGIYRAYAFCDAENTASVRVMEKAGMVREGVLHRWHQCPNLGPEPRDCIVCAKLR